MVAHLEMHLLLKAIVKGDKFSKSKSACPKNYPKEEAMKQVPFASALGSLMYA